MGVLAQVWRFEEAIWPNKLKPLLTLGIACTCFDLEHGIQHLIAPGLIFEATWRMIV